MNKLVNTIKNLGAFGIAPVIISLASILSVPVTLHVLGDKVWLSIAVGQTAGELTRLVTIWGWNSTGLSHVASMSVEDRTHYYLRSVPVRLALLAMATVALFGVSFIVPVISQSAFFLMAMAGGVLGLAGSWVFVGAREPGKLLMFDSLPRALGILLATGLVLLFPIVEVFAGTIIVGNLVAAVGPWIYHLKLKDALGISTTRLTIKEIVQEIRNGFTGFLIGFVMSARMSLPVLLAPTLLPEAATTVALADKIMRWGNTAMTPVMQFVQTGIPRGQGTLSQKIIKGTKTVFLLSIFVATVSTAVAYYGADIMSAGKIPLSFAISALVGLVLGLVFATTVTGNTSLVLLGRTGTVAKYSLLALAILLISIFPAAALYGAVGLMAAYVSSELAILILQLKLLNKLITQKSRHLAEKDQ